MKIQRPAVLFFDVNETLLDLTPLRAAVEKVLHGSTELVNLWFTTMLQYALVETVSGNFEDFGKIGAVCLQMVAKNNSIAIERREAIDALSTIKQLKPHTEVPAALKELDKTDYRLVALSNSGAATLQSQLEYAGLSQYFDDIISVEEVKLYKPHTQVYTFAAEKMAVKPGQCMLIAAHAWDIAGAARAGWQTAFVARPGQSLYALARKPEIVKDDLEGLAVLLLNA